LSDVCWHLLYFWHQNVTVQIRINNVLNNGSRVERDTRQGGISSTFLFCLIFSIVIGWIYIDTTSYNVSCYPDDVLLTSSTVTGLQILTNVANKYGPGLLSLWSFIPRSFVCWSFVPRSFAALDFRPFINCLPGLLSLSSFAPMSFAASVYSPFVYCSPGLLPLDLCQITLKKFFL